MKELFGLPVTTLMWVFGGGLLAIVAWSLFLSLRQPVLFRLASRNIPRRWGRSLLIVLGLTLATTIIAAAMATGDTVAHSARSERAGRAWATSTKSSRLAKRPTSRSPARAYASAVLRPSSFDQVKQAAACNPLIDGVAPAIFEEVGGAEPGLAPDGAARRGPRRRPAYMQGFGTIHNLDGKTIDFALAAAGRSPAQQRRGRGAGGCDGRQDRAVRR